MKKNLKKLTFIIIIILILFITIMLGIFIGKNMKKNTINYCSYITERKKYYDSNNQEVLSHQILYSFDENENCVGMINLYFYPDESYESVKRMQDKDKETLYDDEHNLIITIENNPKFTKKEISKIIKDSYNNNSENIIKSYNIF